MKKSFLSMVALTGFCLSWASASGEQPQQAPDPVKAPVDPGKVPTKVPAQNAPAQNNNGINQQAMEQMMQGMMPGEHHKQLHKYVGEWEVKSKMWMDPSMPPMESTGTAVSKLEFGGRFIFMTYNSAIMGQPFEGRLVMGYNNNTKQFEASWIDTMSTGIWNSTGASSEGGNVFTWNGTFTEPDGEKKATREVTTFRGPDLYVSEFFETGKDGKERKMMELTYSRKAKAPAKPSIEPSK